MLTFGVDQIHSYPLVLLIIPIPILTVIFMLLSPLFYSYHTAVMLVTLPHSFPHSIPFLHSYCTIIMPTILVYFILPSFILYFYHTVVVCRCFCLRSPRPGPGLGFGLWFLALRLWSLVFRSGLWPWCLVLVPGPGVWSWCLVLESGPGPRLCFGGLKESGVGRNLGFKNLV